MILKGFRNKAIKKNIESYLQKRDKDTNTLQSLNTLAVLVDASQSIDIISIVKLANELGVNPDRLKVMSFKEGQKEIEDDNNSAYFNEHSFGLGGEVKRKTLNEFIQKEYDVLINFYAQDKLELNFVAAASKAKLKVGFAATDNRINDLVIGTPVVDTTLFIAELKKYLKILQII